MEVLRLLRSDICEMDVRATGHGWRSGRGWSGCMDQDQCCSRICGAVQSGGLQLRLDYSAPCQLLVWDEGLRDLSFGASITRFESMSRDACGDRQLSLSGSPLGVWGLADPEIQ